ncbi:hypothetical protein Q5H92_14640 [Hymenobacter sp. M29]|uniref:Uncharacterized protein n=1 Tax=Hymenobacter mellowenesis TaxID=3063995 RepID=A0ABT9ACL5_9BACT|nr:hypothetical protein [Hymenobacter sp. M29]MDO7847603.1 hypothetical protein [Hymenobacter sp. M29]
MKDITWEEYNTLFKDDLVVTIRKLLKKAEEHSSYTLEDGPEHGALVQYFNKFGLHKKLTKAEFHNWK